MHFSVWILLCWDKTRKLRGESVLGHGGNMVGGNNRKRLRATPVGCRGGNRYVEGDLLTFG